MKHFAASLDGKWLARSKLFSLLTPFETQAILEQLPKPGSKILVGMSGGVDSSISAALIKDLGCFDVLGCWMKNWDIQEESPSKVAMCSQEKDWQDAKHVAQTLGIPLFQIDLSKEYWCSVWEPTLRQYQLGQTPNPDILCNKFVKFGAFYETMKNVGADYIATGHYARVHPITKKLMRGLDPAKDQSYFLSGVLPSAFCTACFPVGSIPKSKVKILASAAGFHDIVAKPESQGVCFIGERGSRFSSFLEEYLENPVGNFVDVDSGRIVGKHRGAISYTVGQRARVAGRSVPYFVARKLRNDVWIAPGASHDALKASSAVAIFDSILCSENDLHSLVEKQLQCQVRYRGTPADCVLALIEPLPNGSSRVTVQFVNNENCVAEGQTLALYDGDRCVGGGEIVEVNRPFFKAKEVTPPCS
jgi:tRNA-specific 2-thiouridylase